VGCALGPRSKAFVGAYVLFFNEGRCHCGEARRLRMGKTYIPTTVTDLICHIFGTIFFIFIYRKSKKCRISSGNCGSVLCEAHTYIVWCARAPLRVYYMQIRHIMLINPYRYRYIPNPTTTDTRMMTDTPKITTHSFTWPFSSRVQLNISMFLKSQTIYTISVL